jgi:hypothetical protein
METTTGTRWTKWVERPNAKQATVLEELARLGAERAELTSRKAYMTSAGRHNYDQVLAGIRKLIAQGGMLGLGNIQMREQLGITSTAYYKIKGHRTGG